MEVKAKVRPYIPPRKVYRCSFCGRRGTVVYEGGQHDKRARAAWRASKPIMACCPGADAILWDRPMEYAYAYLLRIAAEGKDVEAWIRTGYDDKLYPGTRKDRLTLGLQLARRWREAEWREGMLPPVVTPLGLFG